VSYRCSSNQKYVPLFLFLNFALSSQSKLVFIRSKICLVEFLYKGPYSYLSRNDIKPELTYCMVYRVSTGPERHACRRLPRLINFVVGFYQKAKSEIVVVVDIPAKLAMVWSRSRLLLSRCVPTE
jgi:hypothetical protein